MRNAVSTIVRILGSISALRSGRQKGPSNRTKGSGHGQEHAGNNDPVIATAIVQLLETLVNQQRANQKAQTADEKERSRIDRKRLWIEFVALIIVAVGTVIAVITLILINQSTRATRDAAIEAQRANELTKELERRGERPWLGIHEVSFVASDTKHLRDLQLVIMVLNHGKTPALNVRTRIITDLADIQPNGPPPPGTREPPKSADVNSQSVVFQGQSVAVPIIQPMDVFSPNDIKRLLAGFLLFWGEITYEDAWQTKHRTSVCAFLDLRQWATFMCPKGNIAE